MAIKAPDGWKPMFTQDWFSNRIPQWLEWFGPYAGKSIKGMEIGVFEGKATMWLLENIVTHYEARLFAVDTFQGGEDQITHGVECSKIKEAFLNNIIPFQEPFTKIPSKVRIFEEPSQKALLHMTSGFDFIYIDGSHLAHDVFIDIANSWRLLSVGGTLVFDDYAWRMESEPHKCPYPAIDAFLTCFKSKYERLNDKFLPKVSPGALQVAVRKTNE